MFNFYIQKLIYCNKIVVTVVWKRRCCFFYKYWNQKSILMRFVMIYYIDWIGNRSIHWL